MATGTKTGGRTKGTVNKTTAETKEILKNIVSVEIENINGLLDKLEPKERLDIIIKLLPYILPKQNEIVKEPEPMKEFSIKIIENVERFTN
jgi:hypothetical protein